MDRIIGLDLGSKTCGVSICDALHITCRALTTVRFESDDYDACLEEVLKLLKENKVKVIVIIILLFVVVALFGYYGYCHHMVSQFYKYIDAEDTEGAIAC